MKKFRHIPIYEISFKLVHYALNDKNSTLKIATLYFKILKERCKPDFKKPFDENVL